MATIFRSSILPEFVSILAGAALIYCAAVSAPPHVETPNLGFLAPPVDLPHLVLGYNEVASDALWLRVIQDIDQCEKPELSKEDKVLKLEQMNAPVLGSSSSPVIARCANGWVYRMLDVITEMTPKFRLPYSLGAMSLSVLVDDREGATALLTKGVQRFPDDWIILYRAAYHFLYEEKDQTRASELLVQAGKNGAPQWVFLLAARLATAQGQAILAKSILEEQLETTSSPEKKAELQKRLDAVNETLQRSNKIE